MKKKFQLYCLTCTLLMSAEGSSPGESNNTGDTINFSGYQWVIKDSHGKQTGPGNNYFSGSGDNVWVDNEDRLHLKLTYRDDKWYCPEVRMLKCLGYGQYIFHVEPLKKALDKDVVIGLFLYDRTDTTNNHKEIDIEFSKWGKTEGMNSQYVVQPHEDEAYRYETNLSHPSKHIIDLRKNKLTFCSFLENGINPDSVKVKFAEYKHKLIKPYKSKNEKVTINLWLYKASEPSDLKEMEFIISRFDFTPDKLPNTKSTAPKSPTVEKSTL